MMTAKDAKALQRVRDGTEAQFTDQVLALARLLGWRCCHFRPARTAKGWRTAIQGDVGFVDLVLVREVVIWAELKVGRNKLRPEQEIWARALREAGQRVYCWYPKDWPEIEKTLE